MFVFRVLIRKVKMTQKKVSEWGLGECLAKTSQAKQVGLVRQAAKLRSL